MEPILQKYYRTVYNTSNRERSLAKPPKSTARLPHQGESSCATRIQANKRLPSTWKLRGIMPPESKSTTRIMFLGLGPYFPIIIDTDEGKLNHEVYLRLGLCLIIILHASSLNLTLTNMVVISFQKPSSLCRSGVKLYCA